MPLKVEAMWYKKTQTGNFTIDTLCSVRAILKRDQGQVVKERPLCHHDGRDYHEHQKRVRGGDRDIKGGDWDQTGRNLFFDVQTLITGKPL